MKKYLISFIVLGIICFMSVTALAAPPIKVIVGGEKLETDVAPIIVDGRTMLPVRAVFEAIGAKVNYEASERKVVAVKSGTTVTFVIDSNIMTINGAEKTIDVPAMIKDSRTLVPLRACAEAFDLDVTWNNDTRTARVKIPVSVPVEKRIENTSYIYEYDANGNPTYAGSEYGGAKYVYDENGNLLYKETSDGEVEQYTYNNYGDKTSEHHYSNYEENVYDSEYGNARYNTYEYDYDDNGNRIWYAPSGTDYGNGHWTKSVYDEYNNLTYQENAYGGWEKHTYTYNNSGNILYDEWSEYSGYSSVRRGWKKYEYDANGNKIYYQDSSGFIDKWIYDERNNLVYYEGPGENFDGRHMSQIYYEKYEYDSNDNKTYEETTWFYNGQPTVTTSAWKYDSDGNLTYYEHNNFGDDLYNNWEKYTYDDNGNLICKEFVRNGYAVGLCKIIYEYDSNNNLIYEETSCENSYYDNPYTKYKVIMK